MKRTYLFLIISLFFISGCENKEEVTKNEYLAMKNETLDEANYINDYLPLDIIVYIDRVGEEEVCYKVTLANPQENMHDIKALVVHNYYTEDVFPSIGVFDEVGELLINNSSNSSLVLGVTIQTTTDISKLRLELKILIEYTNDASEKKEIYYKTT